MWETTYKIGGTAFFDALSDSERAFCTQAMNQAAPGKAIRFSEGGILQMKELAKTYDPKGMEDRIYEKWLEKKYFHAEVDRSKKPFTIVIPPPNVTGRLHMGHALDETLQDILIRYKRMQGYNALWVPGTDHASISTEVKVTNQLKEEGIDKKELGREGFLKREIGRAHV